MFSLAKLTALSFIVSPTLAAVIPHSIPPADWYTQGLEPYISYHSRYLALDCHNKHETAFFDQCCHPLRRNEDISSRQAHCNPSTHAAAAEDEDEEACEEVEHSHSKRNGWVKVNDSLSSSQTSDALEDHSSLFAKSAKTVYSGGFATYYYQNGVAGACGKVHRDTDLIAAIDGDRYGDLGAISSLCGKSVRITNTKNNKSVTVLIVDACPTCTNSNSIDLSETAFKQIATTREGIVPITWTFV